MLHSTFLCNVLGTQNDTFPACFVWAKSKTRVNLWHSSYGPHLISQNLLLTKIFQMDFQIQKNNICIHYQATLGWKCSYSTITPIDHLPSGLTISNGPHYNGALNLLCPESVPLSKICQYLTFRAKSAIFRPKISKKRHSIFYIFELWASPFDFFHHQ